MYVPVPKFQVPSRILAMRVDSSGRFVEVLTEHMAVLVGGQYGRVLQLLDEWGTGAPPPKWAKAMEEIDAWQQHQI
jgi:hypothetical protein